MAFNPTNATPAVGRAPSFHSAGAAGTKVKATIQDMGGSQSAAETDTSPWVALPDDPMMVDLLVTLTTLTGGGYVAVTLLTCDALNAGSPVDQPVTVAASAHLTAGQSQHLMGMCKKYISLSIVLNTGTASAFTCPGTAYALGVRA